MAGYHHPTFVLMMFRWNEIDCDANFVETQIEPSRARDRGCVRVKASIILSARAFVSRISILKLIAQMQNAVVVIENDFTSSSLKSSRVYRLEQVYEHGVH